MEHIRKLTIFLYVLAGVFILSPVILYWWIHGDYQRYFWIINQPYPLSHLGSFGYQATLYGTLVFIGVGLLLITLGMQFSRRLLSVLGAVIIGGALVGCSAVFSAPSELYIRIPDWHRPAVALPAMSDAELTEFGIDPSVVPEGYYGHQTHANSIHFTTTETEQVPLNTDGGPDGIYLTIYSIEESPAAWIENWIDFADVGSTLDYEWDFLSGVRHLRYEFSGLGPEKRSDYFLGEDRIVGVTLQPRDPETNARYTYLRLLYNIAVPLVDTTYSRVLLRENCAQEVSVTAVDDITVDASAGMAVLHWTNYETSENQKLFVAYEPETGFDGCSASVTSLLKID